MSQPHDVFYPHLDLESLFPLTSDEILDFFLTQILLSTLSEQEIFGYQVPFSLEDLEEEGTEARIVVKDRTLLLHISRRTYQKAFVLLEYMQKPGEKEAKQDKVRKHLALLLVSFMISLAHESVHIHHALYNRDMFLRSVQASWLLVKYKDLSSYNRDPGEQQAQENIIAYLERIKSYLEKQGTSRLERDMLDVLPHTISVEKKILESMKRS